MARTIDLDNGSPAAPISGSGALAGVLARNVPGAGAASADGSGAVPAAARALIQQLAMTRQLPRNRSRQIFW